MNTTTLSLLNRIKVLTEQAIATEKIIVKPMSEPPEPAYEQRVARSIVDNCWPWMKNQSGFTSKQVDRMLRKKDRGCADIAETFVSAILSKWAKEGYLEVIREHRGRLGNLYRVCIVQPPALQA